MQEFDFTIIGGGCIGLATAYKLQEKYPEKRILLIEKESELAYYQTGNNSGVIHSGLYYKPNSYKAKNCIEGRKALVKFAEKYKIPHDVCGKIVVATHDDELPYLDKIYQTGIQNKIEGIRKIDAIEIKTIEPFCEGIAGIHVPCTGIIDFKALTNKLADLIKEINSESKIHTNEKFLEAENHQNFTIIKTSKNHYKTKNTIYCGGLQSDRLAKNDGIKLKERIVPFRGDYYKLTEQAIHKIKHLIYPVPNPKFPFLGVHFTRMTNGEIECGPNAVLAFKRESYSKTGFSFKDTWSALTYKGTWKLFFFNVKYGIMEYRRAFSKRLFLKTLQRMVPSLTMDDIEIARSGVRAMLVNQDGGTKDDFRIEKNNRSIHVINAPSPAATACLAIGEEVVKLVDESF